MDKFLRIDLFICICMILNLTISSLIKHELSRIFQSRVHIFQIITGNSKHEIQSVFQVERILVQSCKLKVHRCRHENIAIYSPS